MDDQTVVLRTEVSDNSFSLYIKDDLIDFVAQVYLLYKTIGNTQVLKNASFKYFYEMALDDCPRWKDILEFIKSEGFLVVQNNRYEWRDNL